MKSSQVGEKKKARNLEKGEMLKSPTFVDWECERLIGATGADVPENNGHPEIPGSHKVVLPSEVLRCHHPTHHN